MTEPSMLTPVQGETCPVVNLPLPPENPKETCKQNNAYLKFTESVEKGVGKSLLQIGIKVDSQLVDILGALAKSSALSAAIVATYATLMVSFPDLDEKIQHYTKLAEDGWANAKTDASGNNFSAGYVNYLLPPPKAQQQWVEDTKNLEKKIENSNALTRLIEQGKHKAAGLVPTKQTVQKEAIRGTAKVVAFAVNTAAELLTNLLYIGTDGEFTGEVNTKTTAEQKIEVGGSFLDQLSVIGKFFEARNKYFNDHIPSYFQFLGPFGPYAILAGLANYSGLSPSLLVSAWPVISTLASYAVKGTQAVSDVKSRASIDSIKLVLQKVHELLKDTKIPPEKYSDLFARVIVGVSCPAYVVRDADEKLFAKVDKENVTPFLYFLRYASYAYCLDPNWLTAADVTECNKLNQQFSRRYYRIMDNVKGIDGLKLGQINFFVVYDLTIGCFVISFQGTTTMDDVLLDAFGKATLFSYTDNTSKEPKTMEGYAHESMLQVARNCVQLILDKLKKDHPFYQRVPIITTGHSLGAGVAAIAALLLRQNHVYSYTMGIATPACLSPNLAEECQQYVVSIINNADIVPRLSECALFNLTSEDRVCTRSDVKKLVAPGNVFWMREKLEEGQELVQLSANSQFSTTILARIDCLTAHATSSYLKSLKAINPSADPFAIDLDFSLLLPTLPPRKLEPEFLMLYLPTNVANAIRPCINKREKLRNERSERRKEETEKAGGQISAQEALRLREEVNKTRDEYLKQYMAVVKEKKALEQRVKELEDVSKI